MSSPFDPQSAYPQLLTQANDAFKGGHVEVAYHLLMAAMHAAEDTADTGRLKEVAGTCRQMLKNLDERKPPHSLSTRGSQSRGTPNLFETGARTAEHMITGVESEATMKREQSKGPPAVP